MKYFIFTIILISFYGCNDVVDWKRESTEFTSQNNYTTQLLPGIKFTRNIYCWTNSGSANGNFCEYPDMGWLNLSNNNFTSHGCDEVIPMSFEFTAPIVEGSFSSRIRDLNNYWDDIKLTIFVTSTPTENVTTNNISLNPGDSIVFNDSLIYNGINTNSWNNGCISNPYFPSNTEKIECEIYPNIKWVSIEPASFTLTQNDFQNIRITFHYFDPGFYNIYVVKKYEWKTTPDYILFNVTMN